MNAFELFGAIGAIIGLSLGIYFGSDYRVTGIIVSIFVGIIGGYIGGIISVLLLIFILSTLDFMTKPFDLLSEFLWQRNLKRHRLPSIIQEEENKKNL